MSSSRGFFRRAITAINGARLVRAAKDVRNDLIGTRFRASGHNERDSFLRHFKPKSDFVVFAVAFNTPWVVDLLTAAWGKYVADADLVVVDNSKSPEARTLHRDICLQRSVPYCSLPPNPEWNPSRSHAISMNWIYYNLVQQIRPHFFGFIDHDCFPISPFSFVAQMDGKMVYGSQRISPVYGNIWNLWAGFCFFDYSQLADRIFDFKHDYALHLDTGGNNWGPIYSQLSAPQVAAADRERIKNGDLSREIIAGAFDHIGGASYRADFRDGEWPRVRSEMLWNKYIGADTPRIVLP